MPAARGRERERRRERGGKGERVIGEEERTGEGERTGKGERIGKGKEEKEVRVMQRGTLALGYIITIIARIHTCTKSDTCMYSSSGT